MPNQQQISNTPPESRDRWRSPIYVPRWILDNRIDLEIDLACSQKNCLCPTGLYEEMDSLQQEWNKLGCTGYCNPPYSNIDPWLEKGIKESWAGFSSAFLIPTPNGEDRYGKYVFGFANEVIFINGRISFLADCDFTVKGKNGKPDRHYKQGEPVDGNTRGSCIVIYRPGTAQTAFNWVDRDEMISAENKFQEKSHAALHEI